MNRILSRVAAGVALTLGLTSFTPVANAQPTLHSQLRSLSGQVGIWYFYMSTCPYCQKQEPALAMFDERYGIEVTPVSLDGGPPPGREFEEYVPNRGQAARLGVQVTPTLYLVHPATQQTTLLATGLSQPRELAVRIIKAAKAAGWIERPRPESTNTDRAIPGADAGRDRGQGDSSW